MRLLIVSLYWPPAGGAGVQRPLKLAAHLAGMGHEIHVLAPDDPKWLHRDDSLAQPGACHRAPRPQSRPSLQASCRGAPARAGSGTPRPARRAGGPGPARPGRERALERDRDPRRDGDRPPPRDRRRVDHVAAGLGPPHRRGRQAPHRRAWVADLRDSLVSHAHRRHEIRGEGRLARLVASQASAVVCASNAIAAETAGLSPAGPVRVDRATGATSTSSTASPTGAADRFRITHAGSFFGRRDPRPFLDALALVDGVVARFVGDFRTARPRVRRTARRSESGWS